MRGIAGIVIVVSLKASPPLGESRLTNCNCEELAYTFYLDPRPSGRWFLPLMRKWVFLVLTIRPIALANVVSLRFSIEELWHAGSTRLGGPRVAVIHTTALAPWFHI